jgi:hypothetical protein
MDATLVPLAPQQLAGSVGHRHEFSDKPRHVRNAGCEIVITNGLAQALAREDHMRGE